MPWLPSPLASARRLRWRLGAFVAGLSKGLPEVLFVGAFLGGWGLVSLGLALVWGPVVWAFAGGLLLLSACGWKTLWLLARDGLYMLTKDEPR